MRIDSHVHSTLPSMREDLASYKEIEPYWSLLVTLDPFNHTIQGWATPEQMIADMDQAGLEKIILLGEAQTRHENCFERNNIGLKLIWRWPERIIAFAVVQPLAGEEAVDELKRCVDGGMLGMGEMGHYSGMYRFGSPDFLRVVDACIRLNIPINLHSNEEVGHFYLGKSIIPLRHYYRLICRYPEMKLIMAHWGGGIFFYEIMPEVRRSLENVYYDTAGGPLLFPPRAIFNAALQLIDHRKILYGSDYPLTSCWKNEFGFFFCHRGVTHMKAVMLTGAGGTEMLKLMEVPAPVLKDPLDVMVRLYASGLNPVDYKLRRKGGFYPDRFPFILGCDGAGVVQAIGEAVTKFKIGDEVFFFNGGMGGDEQGNYAEITIVHQDYLAAKPKSLSMVEAASVPLVWLTAWEALFERCSLRAGETVLIHGGAGGVGYIAIQIAEHAGAIVLTTVSRPEKAEFARSLGADHCINYKEEYFVNRALALTDGKGVDVVFDTVGGQVCADSFPCTKIYGHVVTLDEVSISKVEAGTAKLRNLTLSYELMLTPMHFKMHAARIRQTAMLAEAARLIDAGHIKVCVKNVFGLDEIDQAHQIIESGHSIGKTVIKIV